MGITERKEREKMRRRNDIIDAAETVFSAKGIENATMDEIAEEAELSKGTLYLYFRNKEELQYAIKIRATEHLNEAFMKAVDPTATGLENIAGVGYSFIEWSRKYPDYFTLLMHFEGKNPGNLNLEDPQIKEFIEKQSPMHVFIEVVRSGQQDGSVRDDISAGIIAHNLWAMTSGVLQMLSTQMQIICMHGIEAEEDVFIEGLFRMIREGIGKR